MEVPCKGVASGLFYPLLLTSFIYLAFVSSGTLAAPYQTSGTYAAPYHSPALDDIESLYKADLEELCSGAEISVATKVLCTLAGYRERATEPEILPVRSWRQSRLNKRAGDLSSVSAFQRNANELRRLALYNEFARKQYQKLIDRGLVSSSGRVIELPASESSSRLRSKMESHG